MFAILHAATVAAAPDGSPTFDFTTKDVVALIGGANVVSEQDHGYLEVLLGTAMPDLGLRFRNLGWEGDTVFSQPRDLNFGSWSNQLRKAGATIIIIQFGQMESLQGTRFLPQFIGAYERLIDEFSRHTTRIVLVSPVPFEKSPPPLPDLSIRNDAAADYSEAIRLVAQRHHCFFVDLFNSLRLPENSAALTTDGIHLNRTGHWMVAHEATRQLTRQRISTVIGFDQSTGALSPTAAEQLRQSILARNRLWFDYWRPMNWAFLAGDRTEQPSSRDHRDSKHRWFPDEMAKFLPLIELKERDIDAQTAALSREIK